jgi:hypothetical protein
MECGVVHCGKSLLKLRRKVGTAGCMIALSVEAANSSETFRMIYQITQSHTQNTVIFTVRLY